jgi:RNA polymerase sigma-70 factor (ECF subfamily)
MPQGEIAAQMGLTRNALYKLTHDARQKLKRGLEAAGIGGDEVRVTFDL